MKIASIGFGNMAQAIFSGVITNKLIKPENISIYDVSEASNQHAKALGIDICSNTKELINNADMIFLSVKPNNFTGVFDDISNYLNDGKILVSIAAGIDISSIQRMAKVELPIIRAMPNTPLLLSCGTTALCANELVSSAAYNLVRSIFGCAGTVYDIPEEQFNHVINLNGSSPAYIYTITNTIAHFANKEGGIPFDVALNMFCDTLKGSAEMLQKAGKTPQELIDAVTSPGGTTLAALNTFNDCGLQETLQTGCRACVERAVEMGKEYQ